MQSIPRLREARPFTMDESASSYLAGALLTVPGRFNVLLRVTTEITVPDLKLGFGPQPLLSQDLVEPGSPVECFLPFAQSATDHRFMVQGTAPSAGAISFTFGHIDRPTC